MSSKKTTMTGIHTRPGVTTTLSVQRSAGIRTWSMGAVTSHASAMWGPIPWREFETRSSTCGAYQATAAATNAPRATATRRRRALSESSDRKRRNSGDAEDRECPRSDDSRQRG